MDTYIVKRGDTLARIADQHGVSLEKLLDVNPQIDNPRSGCVIVFDRGTEPWQGIVDFYVGEHGTEHVYVLGGNQSKQVQISSYRKRKIVGYLWPKGAMA